MSVFKRIWLMLTYGPEIEIVLKEIREKRREEERESNRHRLDLCFKHRQEQNHSTYSEGNCHYCKALKEIERLRIEKEDG